MVAYNTFVVASSLHQLQHILATEKHRSYNHSRIAIGSRLPKRRFDDILSSLIALFWANLTSLRTLCHFRIDKTNCNLT